MLIPPNVFSQLVFNRGTSTNQLLDLYQQGKRKRIGIFSIGEQCLDCCNSM
ncbi:hypothetical protein D922_01139 [Enterococcus faecalis 06-MB-DW-09]|nr:hypothetical protein D931_01333 [Enterococcus faecium 13.SD.W.09]EPH95784.1 hypothetical protein D922_01139 [Enterococcus faecalis 06-MB-DW-09]